MSDYWNPLRIDELKRLAEGPLSATQIANVLGVTKNTIIGKLRRLGIKLALSPGGQAGVYNAPREPRVPGDALPRLPRATNPLSARSPRMRVKVSKTSGLDKPRDLDSEDAIIALPQAPVVAGVPVQIDQLTAERCHWVLGERDAVGRRLYCGRPAARPGSSWCAAHRAKVYAPSRPLAPRDYRRRG